MDVVGRYLGYSLVMVLLLAISMFFSSSEVAIASISHGRVKKLCEDGNKEAKRLLRLKDRQSDVSAYVSMSAILCICVNSVLGTYLLTPATYSIVEKIVALFTNNRADMLTLPQSYVFATMVITFILMSFVSILFGSTLPKKLVIKNREHFALFAIKLLPIFLVVFKPLTYLPIKLANGLSRLFGVNPKLDLTEITEDEIRMLVDAGNQSGSIEISEYEMINNVFEFDDRTAGEVMTHRTDICAVNIKQPLLDVINVAIDEGFSRIPVFENDIDNIVGTIYVKDLLLFTISDKNINDSSIKDYVRDVIFTPESARCRMLFKEFKDKKIHMAVIVDEYGGTAGIVTMEDLLESIVGNIQDEYDQEDEEFEKIDNNTYLLDGGIEIEQISKLFDIEMESDQHTETLGGLITNTLGYIPEDSTVPIITVNGIEFTVLEVEERRITRVKAVRVLSEENIA